MLIHIPKIILLSILVLAFVLPNFQGLAQEKNLEKLCQLEEIEKQEKILSKTDFQNLLKECQEYYEELSVKIGAEITKTEREKRTITNQISIFRNRINRLDAQIRQGNVIIKNLGIQLEDTENSIENTSLKIEDSQEKLAAILRTIYKEDKKSFVEIFLAEDTLSDFFDNLMALETLNLKNQELLENIKSLKFYLESQKQTLAEEKNDLQRIAAIQILQKEEGARAKREQERFLRLTEAEYQKYLREKAKVEKRTAEIRARIFELIGIPEAPTFGQALDLAREVEKITGIRPAFLLAIITQESALGRNVGQCYLPRDPGENRRRRIMHLTRDVPHFLNITQELGRDPYDTLISCPMAFGHGGAMGPAQFIPSTWASRRPILEEYIEGIPNPWNIHHAFLASALYLKDLGAAQNEWRAAMRYFSGARWTRTEEFYGNLVVERTNCLQVFIDRDTMTERCERLIFIPK